MQVKGWTCKGPPDHSGYCDDLCRRSEDGVSSSSNFIFMSDEGKATGRGEAEVVFLLSEQSLVLQHEFRVQIKTQHG